jgi:hypothetical protein
MLSAASILIIYKVVLEMIVNKILFKSKARARMQLSGECLPSMHKALNLILVTSKKS